MDLYAVMTEINVRLATITGLRVAELGSVAVVAPPVAVQAMPDRVNFDATYGRGSDEYEDHIVIIAVGKASSRAALKTLATYLAGSGAKSIKACLDMTPANPYASCADLTVVWAEPHGDIRIGTVDYLGALFHCKITGVGA